MLDIIKNESTFGKLNCILYWQGGYFDLPLIYQKLKEYFTYDDLVLSSFNLDSYEVKEFDITDPSQDDDVIRKIIANQGGQQLIVENFKDHFVIEHLIGSSNVGNVDDAIQILNYFRESNKDEFWIVCGFELSLDVDDFLNSLNVLKSDKSLHPVLVIKQENGRMNKEVFGFDKNSISLRKKEIMDKYLSMVWSGF